MATRAAIYTRISKDAEERGLGVERQRKDCEKLASSEGWKVVSTFVDNDLTAARKNGKLPVRPEFERLLDEIRRGEIDVVVAWEIDRLFRDPFEAESFYLLAEQVKLKRLRTVSDNVNLESGDLLVPRVKAAVAAEEVRKMRQRITRKHEELAAAGRPSGGPRGFGYHAGGVAIREDEAALIREAAARVLDGEAPYAIANDWNARGVVTATGGAWRGKKLSELLRQPRLAGLRVHHGEVVAEMTDREGNRVPAILDRATFERVGRVLASRAHPRSGPPKSYLLGSSILRCGRCGARMTSQPCRGVRGYFCAKETGGCNGIRINADPLEAVVEVALFSALDAPALASTSARRRTSDAESRRTALVATIEEAEETARALSEDYGAGRIKRASFLTAVSAAERRGDEARRELGRLDDVSFASEYLGRAGALREAWPSLSLEKKRRIIGDVFETITINPPSKRGNRFDENRVAFAFRV